MAAWVAADDPLLELVTLLYLNEVQGACIRLAGIGWRPGKLKEGHYFRGPCSTAPVSAAGALR